MSIAEKTRTYTSLLGIGALALTISACGENEEDTGDDNGNEVEESVSPERDVEETVVAFWDDSAEAMDEDWVETNLESGDVDDDQLNQSLEDNEDIQAIVDEYLIVPSYSDEELDDYNFDNNEQAANATVTLSTMLDAATEMFFPTEDAEEDSEESIIIFDSTEPEDFEEGATAQVEFFPSSFAEMIIMEESMQNDEEVTDEELHDILREENILFIAEMEIVDGEWKIHADSLIESIESL